MKLYELLFGALSIVSFILAFKVDDRLYKAAAIFAGFLVLIVAYLSSNMKTIREIAEISMQEIKRIDEKMKIHERLSEHEVRLKNLEREAK